MDKLKWCCKQKKGIKLIDEKDHLSESYLKDSEESLDVCEKIKGKWKIISGYYTCYNSIYSILMKCGIKSEIHDCTIELMNLFNFIEEEILFVINLKNKRINAQYYLEKEEDIDVKKIKEFIFKVKEILNSLTKDDILEIRNKIRNI